MATKKKSKPPRVVTVHEHPRHVGVSEQNPTGITIVDEHPRHLAGTYLNADEITKIKKGYDRKGLIYPAAKKLPEYPTADQYDEDIAVWTDYFNKKFNVSPPLDPDVVKALIGSESGFKADPQGNTIAIGIAQITKPTLAILQDPTGEAKDFIFKNIRQKDLKDPTIAIPMATRWLFRKYETSKNKLNRPPNHQELILEYKGMLKSSTLLKDNALKSYLKKYDSLKKK